MSLPGVAQGRRRWLLGALVLNGTLQAGLAVGTALVVRQGFDGVVRLDQPEAIELTGLAVALLAMVAGMAWLRRRSHIDAERLGQGYVHAVRLRLFRHVLSIGSDGARQMSRGALMLRFVGDLSATRSWVSLGLSRLVVSGLTTLLALTVLAFIDPVIATSVGVATVAAASLALGLGPRLRAKAGEARRRRGRLAALLSDRLTHLRVIEAYGQEDREARRIRRASRRLRAALIENARAVGSLRALSEASASLASVSAMLIGSLQVGAGAATPGSLVAAMLVAGLLAPRLSDLGRVYEYWNAALVARAKQLDVLRLQPVRRFPPQESAGVLLTRGAPLSLRGVTLAPIVRNLDLEIRAGERVAIIGANGAGKSTLLRILAGLVEPERGAVVLGGQDLRSYRWVDLRRAFAMVAPDLPLLRGSLRLNVTYGAPHCSEAALVRVLRQCRLEPLVERLPRGLDTRLAEGGQGLSSGEQARIGIARALLAEPDVLLLDEAEANLDALARAALDAAIEGYPGTVIFATHDPARLARAERVLAIGSANVRQLSQDEAGAALRGAPGSQGVQSLAPLETVERPPVVAAQAQALQLCAIGGKPC